MKKILTYLPYIILTAVIMLPLMGPGFILTHDLVFTPDLHMPEHAANDYLWQVLLYVLNQIVPSQIIEKAILVSVPLLASIGMHKLLKYIADQEASDDLAWHWAIYAGAMLFAVNPFTYSRFMAGQYAVLLGYALLPFFVLALLKFIETPRKHSLAWAVGIALLISIISIHTIGELAVLTVVLGGWGLWRNRKPLRSNTYIKLGLAGLAAFLVLSSYWLIPLLAGAGATAQTIQTFDKSHADAFATQGSGIAGKIYHVMNLQGFWAEGRGLFTLPQDNLTWWGTIRLAIWFLVGWGVVAAWRHQRRLASGLLAVGIISLLFAIGIPEVLLTNLGYREPHKFAGLLAFVFVIYFAYGSARLLYRMQRRSETGYAVSATGILLIVFLFTPTMYWGFAGQLRPREYPSGWQAVNRQLNADNQDFKVLALPWHQYMSFDFTKRIIANPAREYFGKQVIVSDNPELGGIKPAMGTVEANIGAILSRQPSDDFARALASKNIKYIVLFKDHDYREYSYLDTNPDLEVAADNPSIRLYRNMTFKETK
jgi:hypothetical protein